VFNTYFNPIEARAKQLSEQLNEAAGEVKRLQAARRDRSVGRQQEHPHRPHHIAPPVRDLGMGPVISRVGYPAGYRP